MEDENNQDNSTLEDNSNLEPESATSEVQNQEVGASQTTPTNEVFVDNPASQPPLPEKFQKALDEQNGKGKKSSKKRVILLFVLLLLIVGAAVVYYLFFLNKDEEPVAQVTTPVEETANVDALFYQTNTMFKHYQVDAENAVDGFKIPDGVNVLAMNDDGSEVIYASYNPVSDEQGALENMTIVKATADNETTLLATKTYTDDFISSPVVSSDMTKVAYYASENEDTIGVDSVDQVYMAELNGKNKEIALTEGRNDEHGILLPKLWSEDNSTIYSSTLSCYQCDGPSKAEIWKLDVETKELTNVFEQPDDTNSGTVISSPDGNNLAVYATNFSMGPSDDSSANNFEAFVYSLETGESKSIYKSTSEESSTKEFNLYVAGWTQDNSALIIPVFETTEAGTSSSTFNRFDVVSVEDGKISKVPVQMKGLDANRQISATTYGNYIFFTSLTSSEEAESELYNLNSLPLGEGEAEVKTIEVDQPKLEILGSRTITVENN